MSRRNFEPYYIAVASGARTTDGFESIKHIQPVLCPYYSSFDFESEWSIDYKKTPVVNTLTDIRISVPIENQNRYGSIEKINIHDRFSVKTSFYKTAEQLWLLNQLHPRSYLERQKELDSTLKTAFIHIPVADIPDGTNLRLNVTTKREYVPVKLQLVYTTSSKPKEPSPTKIRFLHVDSEFSMYDDRDSFYSDFTEYRGLLDEIVIGHREGYLLLKVSFMLEETEVFTLTGVDILDSMNERKELCGKDVYIIKMNRMFDLANLTNARLSFEFEKDKSKDKSKDKNKTGSNEELKPLVALKIYDPDPTKPTEY